MAREDFSSLAFFKGVFVVLFCSFRTPVTVRVYISCCFVGTERPRTRIPKFNMRAPFVLSCDVDLSGATAAALLLQSLLLGCQPSSGL